MGRFPVTFSVPALLLYLDESTYGEVNSCLRVYSPEHEVGSRQTYDGGRDQHRLYVNEEFAFFVTVRERGYRTPEKI
jgi:hypothetical protein